MQLLFVPATILLTSSSEANTVGLIAMKIWLHPPQLPLSSLSISLVDLPLERIAATRSSATDNPEPFQYPVEESFWFLLWSLDRLSVFLLRHIHRVRETDHL